MVSKVKICVWAIFLDVLFPATAFMMSKAFSEMLPYYQRWEIPLELMSACQWACVALMGAILATVFFVSQNDASWVPAVLLAGSIVGIICVFFDPYGEMSAGVSSTRLLLVAYMISLGLWIGRRRAAG